jgi:hypothetical protein
VILKRVRFTAALLLPDLRELFSGLFA